ncbi:alpha/beta-hydrolase [Martensiomyces pterosporus]|nr:alpha/beta-hydrolase [Martensiomyces pterosporus]
MSFVSACCNTPPVQAEYTPTGETTERDGVTYYIVGNKGSERGVILCYDIFGFHLNAFQFADLLSRSGVRVVVPDFLEGKPLTVADLGNPAVFENFKERRGPWSYNRKIFKAGQRVLEEEGVKHVGAVGFCWGGKLAMSALGEENSGIIGGALVHPSALTKEDFENARGPVFLAPTKDERDFTEDFAIAKAKPFGDKSVQVRFDNQKHGFCGARGDFDKPETADDVNRVIQLTTQFFKSILA